MAESPKSAKFDAEVARIIELNPHLPPHVVAHIPRWWREKKEGRRFAWHSFWVLEAAIVLVFGFPALLIWLSR